MKKKIATPSTAGVGSRLRTAAAVVALCALLGGCRQDLVLKEANDLKDSATRLADAQDRLATALPESCRRKAALRDLVTSSALRSKADVQQYVDSALAARPKDDSCFSKARQDEIELLTMHTRVLVEYAALMERAATHTDIKLETGKLLGAAQKNVLLKAPLAGLPSFITGDNIDQFVNGITDLAVNHSRATALAHAVRKANPLVKQLAAEFVAVFGKEDSCTASSVAAGAAPRWCLVFQSERDLINSEYGRMAERNWPYASAIRKINIDQLRHGFKAMLADARRTGNFTPAADAYVDVVAQVRANTQRGTHVTSLASFERLSAVARGAARRHDADRLMALYENALTALSFASQPNFGIAHDPLREQLDANIKGYKSAIASGTDFASAASDFAAGHDRLSALIAGPVPPDTAIFDR